MRKNDRWLISALSATVSVQSNHSQTLADDERGHFSHLSFKGRVQDPRPQLRTPRARVWVVPKSPLDLVASIDHALSVWEHLRSPCVCASTVAYRQLRGYLGGLGLHAHNQHTPRQSQAIVKGTKTCTLVTV